GQRHVRLRIRRAESELGRDRAAVDEARAGELHCGLGAGGTYAKPASSTSNTSVAFGGTLSPRPRSPYALSGGMMSRRLPCSFKPTMPSSQPLITRPAPIMNP